MVAAQHHMSKVMGAYPTPLNIGAGYRQSAALSTSDYSWQLPTTLW